MSEIEYVKKDKKCPGCGNDDVDEIEESFSHLDTVFYYEYQCRLCGVFWRRVFKFDHLEVRKDKAWRKSKQ